MKTKRIYVTSPEYLLEEAEKLDRIISMNKKIIGTKKSSNKIYV